MQTAALFYKLLCAHNGSMELEELRVEIYCRSLDDGVDSLLARTDLCSIIAVSDESKLVIAKTKVRVCKIQDCNGCCNLHLCKLYLYGDCPHVLGRQGCHFCHDLTSEHNVRVLRENDLQELDREELCTLLLQNDNSLLPPVCFTYNRGVGEYGHCPDKENCTRLHICNKYVRGTCASECNKSHDFYEPHPMKTLQDRGVSNKLIGSMLSVYQNNLTLRDSNSNNSERVEICLFNMMNCCKYGDRCRNVHFNMPYKWEVRDGGWSALPDNEGIESDYCDPAKSYSDGSVPVHFDTMTHSFVEVRRLSTASSVVQPNFVLATKWAWYWEDKFGHWTQYAASEEAHHSSSISSEDLEKKYQEDRSATIEFTAGKHTYELNMQDMIQFDKQNGTRSPVRRRAEFISEADIQMIKSNALSSKESISCHSRGFRAVPHCWDKSCLPETGFKRVILQSYTDEFKKILDLFNKTMSGFRVNRIERVQNRALQEVFQWQIDFVRKNNAGNENEKLLFHGTDSRHIDAICQQSFDWRICGTHGTAYGNGSYFARDAMYSHYYTSQAGTRSMFVCRVLVGDYTKGDPSYLRPPSKDGGEAIFYDSCVDDISNPSVFVVFEKHQVYPEYLIQYEEIVRPSDMINILPAPPQPVSVTVQPTFVFVTNVAAFPSPAAPSLPRRPRSRSLTLADNVSHPFTFNQPSAKASASKSHHGNTRSGAPLTRAFGSLTSLTSKKTSVQKPKTRKPSRISSDTSATQPSSMTNTASKHKPKTFSTQQPSRTGSSTSTVHHPSQSAKSSKQQSSKMDSYPSKPKSSPQPSSKTGSNSSATHAPPGTGSKNSSAQPLPKTGSKTSTTHTATQSSKTASKQPPSKAGPNASAARPSSGSGSKKTSTQPSSQTGPNTSSATHKPSGSSSKKSSTQPSSKTGPKTSAARPQSHSGSKGSSKSKK